ncbi:MAG: GNAT family N-acetyltransferase [Treponema sp.]|nr:GNAT family N-acetyltransferase [Treponema sp.]
MPERELLEIRIRTLFTLSPESKLLSINEPSTIPKPAPRLYIGKTIDDTKIDGKIIYYFGKDVLRETIEELKSFLERESALNESKLIDFQDEYLKILAGVNYEKEIFYHHNWQINPSSNECILIAKENIDKINLGEFDWLAGEIHFCQPCFGITENNVLVSICRSVRIGDGAHEAGIETIEEHRGKSHAQKVLINWINKLQGSNIIPFYSTSIKNKASQRVAEKAGLKYSGIGLSIY